MMKCIIDVLGGINNYLKDLWYLCSILILEYAVPQNWIPYVQIGFSMVLYSSILFFNVNCEFLLVVILYILLSLGPKFTFTGYMSFAAKLSVEVYAEIFGIWVPFR